MDGYKNILFPIDLSSASEKIVPHARAMAEKFGSALHILFVARAFEYFRGVYVPNLSITTLENQIVEGAEKRMEEFVEEHFKGMADVRPLVVSGYPSEEILNYVDRNGIDLIIMGTHGRKGLDKVMFGSVAERVVKSATVPVFVVNPYREEE